MFRLTREVRFAAVASTDAATVRGMNGHGGVPPMQGLERFLVLRVALEGPLDVKSSYLRNIKDVDDAVRAHALPRVARHLASRPDAGTAALVLELLEAVGAALNAPAGAIDGVTVTAVSLAASPYQSLEARTVESGMVRLSQKFEFSAAHRLHNPALGDEENRALFGKCNNPLGHGHNYELQVTLAGLPDESGRVMSTDALEKVVDETILKRFDHKHLNEETDEFRTVIPSVEQIARVIYYLLKPHLSGKLASVTVWETPKTWCEYSE